MSDQVNPNQSGERALNRRPLRQSDAQNRYRKRSALTSDNAGTLRLLVKQSMKVLQKQLKHLVTTTVKETLSAISAAKPAEQPPPPTAIFLPPPPAEPIATPSTVWLEDVALKRESDADEVPTNSERECCNKRRKTIKWGTPQDNVHLSGSTDAIGATSRESTSLKRKQNIREQKDTQSSGWSASSKASSDGSYSPRHEWSDEYEDADSDDQDDNDAVLNTAEKSDNSYDPFWEDQSTSNSTANVKGQSRRRQATAKTRRQRKSTTSSKQCIDDSDSDDDHESSLRDTKHEEMQTKDMSYHYTPGARLGSQLVYSTDEKQLYRLHIAKGDQKNYACIVESCRARVSISGDFMFKTKRFVAHNHSDQELKMQKYAFESKCKTECQQTGADPNEVYRRVLQKFPSIGQHSSLGRMLRNLNRLSEEKSTRKHLVADPNEQLPYDFVPGFRRGSQMLYTTGEKQLYHKRHSFEDRTRFACAVKTCSASIFLIGDLLRRPDKYKPHNHGDQERKMLEWKQQAVALNEKDEKMIEKFTRNVPATKHNSFNQSNSSSKNNTSKPTTASAATVFENLSGRDDPVNAKSCRSDAPTETAAVADASVSLPYFYTPGGRLGSTLLYSIAEKQLYRLHTSRKNKKFFACAAPFCKARVNMSAEVLTRVKKFVEHNHGDQEHKLRKYAFDTACKMECKQSGASPMEVYQKVLEKFPSDAAEHTPLSKLSRNLNRLAGIVKPRTRKMHPRSAELDVNEVLPYHFTSGAHINTTLLYSSSEKQLYRLHRTTPDRKRYTCHVDACPAAVFLDNDGALRRAPGRALHTAHGEQDQVALKIGFKVACRQECRKRGVRPMEAYQKMLKKFPLTGQQVNFKHVKRQLTRLRSMAMNKPTDDATDAAQTSADHASASSEQPAAASDAEYGVGNALENLLNAADADVPQDLNDGRQLIDLQVDTFDVEELLTADAIPIGAKQQ